jgi:hypothetical protein
MQKEWASKGYFYYPEDVTLNNPTKSVMTSANELAVYVSEVVYYQLRSKRYLYRDAEALKHFSEVKNEELRMKLGLPQAVPSIVSLTPPCYSIAHLRHLDPGMRKTSHRYVNLIRTHLTEQLIEFYGLDSENPAPNKSLVTKVREILELALSD